jgi:hypothetical protein
MLFAAHVHVPNRVHVLEQHRDSVAALNDLKREWHVHDSWHTRQETLAFRIRCHAVLVVLLLLRRGPWLIGDVVSLDDAEACRHAFLRVVALNVPGGRVDNLPNA